MRILYCAIVLILTLGFIAPARADAQNFSIKGEVRDTSGSPISNATITVYLSSKKDSIVKFSDKSGKFNIKLAMEALSINVSHIGFIPVRVLLAQSNTLNDSFLIVLSPFVNELSQVTLTQSVPKIKILKDTIEFIADSFVVRKDAELEDLLKRLPGVKVNKDGSLIAFGQSVTKIKVNGKDFFDGSPTTVTKNLPAKIVSKIQIIDDYGESGLLGGANLGSSEKIINIELKKDKRSGLFARSDISGGPSNVYNLSNSTNLFDDKTQASFFGSINNINRVGLNTLKNGISGTLSQIIRQNNNTIENLGGSSSAVALVNNQDFGFLSAFNQIQRGVTEGKYFGGRFSHNLNNKVSVYISAIHNSLKNSLDTKTYGEEHIQKNYFNSSEQNLNYSKSTNYRVYGNIEFKPDSAFTLRIMPVIQGGSNNNEFNNNRIDNIANIPFRSSQNISIQEGRNSVQNISSFLRKTFKGSQYALLADLNFQNLNSIVNNKNWFVFTSQFNDTSNQRIKNSSKMFSVQGRISLLRQINSKTRIELLFQNTYSRSFTNRHFFIAKDSNYQIYLPSSGQVIIENLLNQPTFLLRKKYLKSNYTFGIGVSFITYKRTMDTSLRSSKSAFIPIFEYSYQFSRTRYISMRYTANWRPPEPQQLLALPDSSNPVYLVTGNSNLKPEFQNQITFNYYNFDYINGNVFILGISAQSTANKIIQSIKNDASGKIILSYVNANRLNSISGYYNISRPYKNKSFEITATGNLSFNQFEFVSSINIPSNVLNWYQKLSLTLNKSFGEIDMYAAGSGGYGLINDRTYRTIDWMAGVDSKFYIKKLTISSSYSFVYPKGYFISPLSTLHIFDLSVKHELNPKLEVKVEGVDIFNQNIYNNQRRFLDNNVRDSRSSVLGRYFILSFLVKINKFY